MLIEFLTKHENAKVDKEDISIPDDISTLGGALYIAVLKNVAEENWDAEYEQYLRDFKETLQTINNGDIDEKSCLTELAAAQISAPAIESGYDKTTAAIEKAANVLDLNEQKLESPKYMSLGRRFLNWITHKPKCIIAAALAAGILFSGVGNTLIGPGPAYGATTVENATSRVSSAIKNGLDFDFNDGSFEFEYDGKKVQRKLGRIGADVAEDIVSGAIQSTLDGIFGNITPSKSAKASKKAVSPSKIVSTALYNDAYSLSQDAQKIALTGAHLLKYLPMGLTASELTLAVQILAPDFDDRAISNIAQCIASMGAYDKETETYTMPSNRSEELAAQMKKKNKKFNEYESMIAFATSVTKIAQNLSASGEDLGDTFGGLVAKAQEGIKELYNNPVVEKMKEFTTGEQNKIKAAAKEVASSMIDYPEMAL